MVPAGIESKVSKCPRKYTTQYKGFKLTLISFYFASKWPDFIYIFTMKAQDKKIDCVIDMCEKAVIIQNTLKDLQKVWISVDQDQFKNHKKAQLLGSETEK